MTGCYNITRTLSSFVRREWRQQKARHLAGLLTGLKAKGLRLNRHRLLEVFVDLVEEAGGGEPLLLGADEEGEVLGHEAGLDRVDADLLQRRGEAGELRVVVELGAVR